MASDVHKNTDTKVETVSANSVCRQLPQKTAEQGLAAAVAFAEEVQWSLAIRRTISGVGFGEALKLLMNDRDLSVEQMESESGFSVSTVKRLRAGQDASVEQIVAISVALHLPPPVKRRFIEDVRNHAGFQQSKEYCLSDDSDGVLQRRHRTSQ